MNLAALVKTLRARHAMSMEEMGRLCGCSKNNISELESGANWNLKVANLVAMARGLKIDPAVILAAATQSMIEAAARDVAEFQKGDTSG